MIPVRCFSCGKVVGDKWEPFIRRVEAGEKAKDVLDDLGLTRYCCRRMIISNVDIIDELIKYDLEKKVLREYDKEYKKDPKLYDSKKNLLSERAYLRKRVRAAV